jgi:hypothetical protein
MKLSNWFDFMLKCELDNCFGGNYSSVREKYVNLCNEFWKLEGEDRDIVLEDLKKDEGLLYKKMCEWNENELIIELGLNMVWWEYSLEDYFRDLFDKDDIYTGEFGLFSVEDINKMMYGEDYEEFID